MDFFDEEYNKQRVIDNSVGYNNPPPQPQRAKNRVLQKILTVVAFVAVFVVGIVDGYGNIRSVAVDDMCQPV